MKNSFLISALLTPLFTKKHPRVKLQGTKMRGHRQPLVLPSIKSKYTEAWEECECFDHIITLVVNCHLNHDVGDQRPRSNECKA